MLFEGSGSGSRAQTEAPSGSDVRPNIIKKFWAHAFAGIQQPEKQELAKFSKRPTEISHRFTKRPTEITLEISVSQPHKPLNGSKRLVLLQKPVLAGRAWQGRAVGVAPSDRPRRPRIPSVCQPRTSRAPGFCQAGTPDPSGGTPPGPQDRL